VGGTPAGEKPKVVHRLTIIALLTAANVVAVAGSAQALTISALIAPPSVCKHQRDRTDPAPVQEQAMRCMTNFARRHAGRARLGEDTKLDRSAGHKSRDIVRCNSFSHYACGRDFTFWMRRVGYLPTNCWRAGENIAWGSGSYGSVRSIFGAWMHSPEHRDNILARDYGQFGVGLDSGRFDGYSGAAVWVQHFGEHC
jgi:uncharacterized protein YkwD